MESRTVAHGEKITEAGIYDIIISRYHSQCCDGVSLSSSGIRQLLRSPAEFWLESDLNPNRVVPEDKAAFVIGRAAHHLLLGEAKFSESFSIRPDKWNDWRTSEARQWKVERELEGKTVLTDKDIDLIRGMAGLQPWQRGMTNCGLANTAIVANGILGGEIEKSLIWQAADDPFFGKLWLKARPDAIPTTAADVADLKTTNSVADRDLQRTIFERGYHIQGALVGMACRSVLDMEMQSFTLVFVDKKPPHPVAVKTLKDSDIALGEEQIRLALRLFAKCYASGVWPGPTAREADGAYIEIPKWGREEIEFHMSLIEQDLAA